MTANSFKKRRFCKIKPLLFSHTICYFITLLLVCTSNIATAQPVRNKVVLISLDGVPDYLVDEFLANGVLSSNGAFAKMKQNGAHATTVLPINVASTGPSHISIFTGASPSTTGIVGNSFRKRGQDWNSPNLSAFQQPIAAETIFQAAMRQGKKVLSLAGVGIDYSNSNRMTNYMHMYPRISGPSLVIDLEVTDTTIHHNDVESFVKLKVADNKPSPPIFEVKGKFKIPLYFYLKDRMLNPMYLPNQPIEIGIDTDSDFKNGFIATVVAADWTNIEIELEGKKYNTSFKIFNSDEKTGRFQLYMAAPSEVFGYPSEFLQKLQTKCGLWPGEPDNKKQTVGLVSETIWFEQLDRLSKYSKELLLTSMKESNWDLLFGYFSTLDDVQHRYTLTNPRQLDYTADQGNRPIIYRKIIEEQFKKIDAYLLEIINELPENTNLVVFSDHGMIPVHTTLLLNNYIEHIGLDKNQQTIKAVSSGSSAHIYINKGKLNTAEYDRILNRIVTNLNALNDSKTGKKIVELVATKNLQRQYGIAHDENSGDVFISCTSGYSISDRYLPEVPFLVQNSFDPTLFESEKQATKNFLLSGTMNETGRAVHGQLSSSREGQSIFYAIGPNVPNKEIKLFYSLQIAPIIANLLGIEPPKNAEMISNFDTTK